MHVIAIFNRATNTTVFRRSFQPRGYDRLVDMSDEGIVQAVEQTSAAHLKATRVYWVPVI